MKWIEVLRALLLCFPQLLRLLARWIDARDKRAATEDLHRFRRAVALGDADRVSRALWRLLEDGFPSGGL